MKTHRVGSITLGAGLVSFGTLFFLHIFFPLFHYRFIFRLWPILLVSLGIEVLVANARSEKIEFVYDGWAVVLMFLVVCFSAGMSLMDFSSRHFQVW